MKMQLFPYKLFYKYAFKIAHTERAYTPAVFILLHYKGFYAFGEAVFPPYYPETIETASAFYEALLLPKHIEDLNIPFYSEELLQKFPNHTFAIAGLDIALNNLKAKVSGGDLFSVLNTTESNKKTSFTLGISSKELMELKILENPQISYFKLKVDQHEIGRIIEDYLSLSNKPFVIDANQGFTSFEEAAFWVKELKKLNVAYIEQPFHKDDFESHERLKAISELPLFADESFQRNTSLETIKKAFDGVNVKLMKAGGLSMANSLIDLVSADGLKIVLGCMSESSLGITAAESLKKKVDWVDLDGHLLINNDPFNDVENLDKTLKKLTKNS